MLSLMQMSNDDESSSYDSDDNFARPLPVAKSTVKSRFLMQNDSKVSFGASVLGVHLAPKSQTPRPMPAHKEIPMALCSEQDDEKRLRSNSKSIVVLQSPQKTIGSQGGIAAELLSSADPPKQISMA